MLKNVVSVAAVCVLFALGGCDQPVSIETPCLTDLDCPSEICLDGICGTPLGDLDAAQADATSDVAPGTDASEDAEPTEDVGGADVAPDDTTGDVRPADTGEPNPCGGTVALVNPPGGACGQCNAGAWACDGVDATVCEEPDPSTVLNGCGGCAVLARQPGTPCGGCGEALWACDGADTVVCAGAITNACGGCTVLDREPGAPCGACGGGVLACDGSDSVVCEDDGGLNGCGGCGPLTGTVGAPCGTCNAGVWTCGGDDVVCVGDSGVLNGCGGCTELTGAPGDACGACDSGALVCNGTDALRCADDAGAAALNVCGGCEELDNVPGDACGTCDEGQFVCSGDTLVCEGDPGDGGLNDCGGCTPLPGFGALCGGSSCDGRQVCDGANRLVCECAPEPCGNGVWDFDIGEECDDGNLTDGDGCDDGCRTEGEPDDDTSCSDPFLMPRNGQVTFDSCDLDDDTRPADGDPSCSTAGDAADAIMEFTLPVRSRVSIVARDNDNTVAVDTRVYVRSTCNNRDSQLGCGDDVLCEDAAVHTTGCVNSGSTRVQPRESFLSLDLDAGTYTLVFDTQTGRLGSTNFGCGEVLVYMFSEPI